MKKIIAITVLLAAGLVVVWMAVGNKSVENDTVADTQQAENVEAENNSEEKKPEKKEIIYNVEFYQVGGKTLRNFVVGSATLQADRQVDIFSKTNGQIQKLMAEEGQSVESGEVLLVLDGEEEELELQQMTVNLNKAKAEFERISKSYESNLIAAEEYEAKKFELEKSVADHERAAHKVTLTKVRAPFAGTITKRAVEIGQTIQPSEVLFTLAALNPLEAEVFLTEKQVSGLAAKQDARFSRTDNFEDAFSGHVKQISPVVDKETGTVKVTMAIPNAPVGIRPGTYVHLRVVTDVSTLPTVVPKRALVFDSRQQAYAFVTKPHEDREAVYVVEKVPVTLGMEEGEWVSVSEGLESGKEIVLTGKESLKTGSLVRNADEVGSQEIAQL